MNYVKTALKKACLELYFKDKVLSAEQVEKPKPSPELFLHVSSRLGYKPKDCIVIEDSITGVRAAQNAEMQVISFSGAAHFVPSLEKKLLDTNATWHCSSVTELENLLLGGVLL